MKEGDKVKKVQGNPFGKVGIIKKQLLMTRPTTVANGSLKKAKPEYSFYCVADDGTDFSGFEDELEIVE